jgi:hypothetical protein
MATDYVHIDTASEMVREVQEKLDNALKDNTRAWERVAQLESTVSVLSAECSRLTSELARTYT